MKLEFRRALRYGILAFVLHNGEEALTMPSWLQSQLPRVALTLGLRGIQPPSTRTLYVGLITVTVVPALVVAVGARAGSALPGLLACLFLYAILFWNALVPHVVLTVLLRSYTPGVATAALVNLPCTVYLFRRAVRDGHVTRVGMALTLGLAAIAYPMGMLLLWAPRFRAS